MTPCSLITFSKPLSLNLSWFILVVLVRQVSKNTAHARGVIFQVLFETFGETQRDMKRASFSLRRA